MTDVVNPVPDTSAEINGAPMGPTGQTRSGLTADALRAAVKDHLMYSIARPAAVLTPEHYYQALSLAVRDRMQKRWMTTTQDWLDLSAKVTCYLSAEFLMGPQLGNNLLNLGIEDAAREALADLGQDLDVILACEERAGAGQRRPGPAGRLLPGLAGHPGAPVDRLRHPLRVRHLRPGDPRRLAGREDRQLAGARQPVGDRQAGRQLHRQLGRPHRDLRGRHGPAAGALGARSGCSRASPTTPRCRATASTPATR